MAQGRGAEIWTQPWQFKQWPSPLDVWTGDLDSVATGLLKKGICFQREGPGMHAYTLVVYLSPDCSEQLSQTGPHSGHCRRPVMNGLIIQWTGCQAVGQLYKNVSPTHKINHTDLLLEEWRSDSGAIPGTTIIPFLTASNIPIFIHSSGGPCQFPCQSTLFAEQNTDGSLKRRTPTFMECKSPYRHKH